MKIFPFAKERERRGPGRVGRWRVGRDLETRKPDTDGRTPAVLRPYR